MQFSPLLLAVMGILPTLSIATPASVGMTDELDKRQWQSWCCLPGCHSCGIQSCLTQNCYDIPFTSCCSVGRAETLDDGTVEMYNVDGVKVEFFTNEELEAMVNV